jgi:hypothetical protein
VLLGFQLCLSTLGAKSGHECVCEDQVLAVLNMGDPDAFIMF